MRFISNNELWRDMVRRFRHAPSHGTAGTLSPQHTLPPSERHEQPLDLPTPIHAETRTTANSPPPWIDLCWCMKPLVQ